MKWFESSPAPDIYDRETYVFGSTISQEKWKWLWGTEEVGIVEEVCVWSHFIPCSVTSVTCLSYHPIYWKYKEKLSKSMCFAVIGLKCGSILREFAWKGNNRDLLVFGSLWTNSVDTKPVRWSFLLADDFKYILCTKARNTAQHVFSWLPHRQCITFWAAQTVMQCS